MTDPSFIINFDLDLDTDTVEGQKKKNLDWENWQQLSNRKKRKTPDDTRRACLICKKLYCCDYLRKHMQSASHLRKEKEYFNIEME
jgi:hypothetical protein